MDSVRSIVIVSNTNLRSVVLKSGFKTFISDTADLLVSSCQSREKGRKTKSELVWDIEDLSEIISKNILTSYSPLERLCDYGYFYQAQ